MMRGDLVNFVSFAVVVPGYYYMALSSYVKSRSSSNNITNKNMINPSTNINNNKNIVQCHDAQQKSSNNNLDQEWFVCPEDNDSIQQTPQFSLDDLSPDLLPLCEDESCGSLGSQSFASTTDTARTQERIEYETTNDSDNILSNNQNTTNDTSSSSSSSSSGATVKQQILVCVAFTITICLQFASWYYRNKYISAISFIFSWTSTTLMNVFQWPHQDEKILIPQYIWHLLILNGNGSSLPFMYQIGLGFISLVYGSFIASHPPYSMEESFPILFGSTALHVALHISLEVDESKMFSLRNDTFRTTFASVLLTTVFAYHVFNEIVTIFAQPGYAMTGGFSIVRAGFFASFGIFAAGAFKHESIAKELLEKLVQERTQQISQQARRLRMVEMALEASETAIAITDHNMNIVWFNPALKRLTAKQETELANSNVMDALMPSPEDCENIKACFDDKMTLEKEITVNGATIHMQVGPFLEDDDLQSMETMNGCKNCQYGSRNNPKCDENGCLPDNISATTRQPGSGGASRFVVVLKDFTERRKRLMAEKTAEHESLLKQAMLESCQILSHELRTPLQGIMGITSMLLDSQDLKKDVEDAMSLVMVSSRLLLTLINNMLDVRKCDANMMSEFELVPTDLLQPIEDAVNFCRPLGAMSSVQIDMLTLHSNDIVVLSDALRLQQVVINLVSNSIKHSPSGCTITIQTTISTLAQAEDEIRNALRSGFHQDAWDVEYKNKKHLAKVVIVSVSDTGNGIDVEQAGKLFQQFSQLNDHCSGSLGGTKVGQPSGTGLGLNLCLKFVHRMRGNIWASNNPNGKGARFSFYLPLFSGGESTSNKDHTTTSMPRSVDQIQPVTTTSPSAVHCRVLVVDDTLINLKVLDRMLRKVGVNHVRCVDSGHKALSMLEVEPYHLVITDIQMPGMSGTDLCEEIFRRFDQPSKPVVVGLTAEVSKAMDEKCAKSGMLTVLHKPLTAHQLKDFFDQVVCKAVEISNLDTSEEKTD